MFLGSSVLPNRITASMAGYSPPCTPALTNNTGPGFSPATEITDRGSSFANAAPGNLMRYRCVLPGVISPNIGSCMKKYRSGEQEHRKQNNLDFLNREKSFSCVPAFLRDRSCFLS